MGSSLWLLDRHVAFKHVLDFEPKPDEKIPAFNPSKTKWNARVRCQPL